MGEQVKVVFVTTDPARDSAPVLRVWLDNFDRGNGLKPAYMVAMVFHMRHKNDGPQQLVHFRKTALFYVISDPFRYSQPQYPLQLIYSSRRSTSASGGTRGVSR